MRVGVSASPCERGGYSIVGSGVGHDAGCVVKISFGFNLEMSRKKTDLSENDLIIRGLN